MAASSFGVTLGCMNRPWTEYPFERALAGIREAEFRHFALLRHGGRLTINPDTPPEEALAIGEQVRSHGMDVVMIPHFVRFENGDGADEGALAAAKRQIDHCARLGARVLLEMGYPREEGYERYFALMRRAAPYAEEQGVTIAIKPHGGLSRTAAGTLYAVKRVDHPAYRICYDAGNLLHAQEERPEVSLRAMAPYTLAMCIKGATPEEDETLPRPGGIDYGEIFRVLHDHGFAGPATVENLGPGGTGSPNQPAAPPEVIDAQAQRTYRYLAALLASL